VRLKWVAWSHLYQESRADNVLTGSKKQNMEQLRADMRAFKAQYSLDKVVVLWTANTERFSEVVVGMNDTYANLMAAIDRDEKEVRMPRDSIERACSALPCVGASCCDRKIPASRQCGPHTAGLNPFTTSIANHPTAQRRILPLRPSAASDNGSLE
jgi:hypothetical protein